MSVILSSYLENKNPEFKEKNPRVVQGLEQGHLSRGHHFEKLKIKARQYALFSIRLSIKSRLLLTLTEGGDWLLLDELAEHEYDKSPFLKVEVLKRCLQDKAFVIRESSSSLPASEKILPVMLEFFNHQFIELNDEQAQTLYYPLPLVVSGMPGSGKSCVALSMLRQCIDQPEHRLLYITSSSRLVETMRDTWNATPGTETADVEFKTYDELFPMRKMASMREFAAWFQQHTRMKRELNLGMSDTLDLESLIYQEFRMMSAYALTDYQLFSDRQRLFDAEKYPKLYQILAAYRTYLEEQDLIDVSLLPLLDDIASYTAIFLSLIHI